VNRDAEEDKLEEEMGIEYKFLGKYAGFKSLYKKKFLVEQQKSTNKNQTIDKIGAPHCCKLFFMSLLLFLTLLVLNDMSQPTFAYWNCQGQRELLEESFYKIRNVKQLKRFVSDDVVKVFYRRDDPKKKYEKGKNPNVNPLHDSSYRAKTFKDSDSVYID